MSNVHKEKYSQTSLQVHVLKRGIQVSLLYIYIYMAESASGQDEILWSDWLPERASWTHLARSGFPASGHYENVFFMPNNIINPLLNKLAWSTWLDIGLVYFSFFFLRFYRPRLNLGPLKRRKNVTSIQPFWLHAWPHGEAFFLKCQLIVAFQFIIKRIKKLYNYFTRVL